MILRSTNRSKIGKICHTQHLLTYENERNPIFTHTFVGIDPGVTRLGVTIIIDVDIYCMEIQFPTLKKEDNKTERYCAVRDIINDLTRDYKVSFKNICVIEGVNYNPKFREVTLDEARAVISASIQDQGYELKIVPPKAIRKFIFGNGNKKAEQFWPMLEPDAASSLACALFGLKALIGELDPNISYAKDYTDDSTKTKKTTG